MKSQGQKEAVPQIFVLGTITSDATAGPEEKKPQYHELVWGNGDGAPVGWRHLEELEGRLRGSPDVLRQ